MLGATLLTGFWLWLVDSGSSFRNQQLTILILCVPSVVLTDSGILTDLASHGLLLALLIISVLPNWQVELLLILHIFTSTSARRLTRVRVPDV